MRRFTVVVDDGVAEQLTALARAERRDPRDQAALLLERALRSRGLPVASAAVTVPEGADARSAYPWVLGTTEPSPSAEDES